MAQNSSWFRRLFGDEILNSSTELKSVHSNLHVQPIEKIMSFNSDDSDSTERVVGIYFTAFPFASGSFHESYEEFTRKLVDFYNRINCESGDDKPKKFEVIQVFLPSTLLRDEVVCDRDQLKDVLLEVPWFALPLQDEIRRVQLKHRFKAKDGAVVLLSAETGQVLSKNCRDKIEEDPEGVYFPWLPRSVLQIFQEAAQGGLLLGGIRCDSRRKKMPLEDIDGCIKGIYFSAHWCPPCRAFTPHLIETYKKIKARGYNFEIIFVSSDRTEESYKSYLSTMPWTAIDFRHTSQRQELTTFFHIQGIPSLIILDSDGNIITEDGRSEVNEDPEGELFPWRPKLVNILLDRFTATLYHSPAIVFFLEKDDDEEIEFAESVLTSSAEWVQTNCHNIDCELKFFIALKNDASDSLRYFVGLDDASPLLTAIDFPANRVATMEYGAEITRNTVKTFVQHFVSDQLPFLKIQNRQVPPNKQT